VNPYEVLGVSPGATPDEVRRAYLALARRHHPDAGGNTDEMRRLNEAWATFSAVTTPASQVQPDVETTRHRMWDAEEGDEVDDDEEGDVVIVEASRRSRLIDDLTLLLLLAWLSTAALSFLFALLFESGPLLGFCVFCLFMSGVFVVARTLLAMGFDRKSGR
jgi:hypothetical protein